MMLVVDDSEKEISKEGLALLLREKSQALMDLLGLEVFDEQGLPVELEICMKGA